MNLLQRIIIASTLSILFSSTLLAQTEPVVVEAESGVLGAQLATATLDGVGHILLTGLTIGGGNPTTDERVATYQVTFPVAGTYELYARFRVGPVGPEDDSMYYGNGFGVKLATSNDDWILANQLSGSVGYTNPTDKVVGGGLAGNQVWKWLKFSAFDGGEPPRTSYVVTEGNLTQTFQLAGREDGLRIDKFAFGFQGVFYTVNDLDNRLPGSTVPPPPPFVPPGPPIATGQAKFLGSAHSPSQSANFAAYWNKVTPENAGKWGSVEGTRDVMNWTQLDTAYNLARSNGFPFHMHVLVWGNQQPAWIETLPPAEQLEEIQEWFAAVAARYPDADFIEVVNEPLHDPPNQAGNGGGNYIEALGGNGATGWDWILNAFRMARPLFPNSKLMLNDFSITNSANSTTNYLAIIELLKAENLIDAIGVQGHAFSTRPNIPMSTHVANLDSLAATGLPIYVTELDIDGPTDEIQLADYQRIFPVFWEHPAVQGITLWGYRPGHWRSAQGAYIVLDNGAERPAMLWLQDYVQDAVPAVTPGQSFNVSEAAAGGSAVGTVLATDADVGTLLDQWRIDGGSGAAVFAIDPATGALSVAAGAALDFEAATSYTLSVSVYDGFRRSTAEVVTVNVTNENDNAPVIGAAQSFRIDGGFQYVIGSAVASDADDTNQPGFTTFQNWQIVGGSGASIFAIDAASGAIRISRPLLINFKRTSYDLLLTVSDGASSSASQAVTITIPDKVKVCFRGHDLVVPKLTAPLFLWLGGRLGTCSPP